MEQRVISGAKHYFRAGGLRGLISAVHGKLTHKARVLKIGRPELRFPFFVRVPSSDVYIYRQIFSGREYDFDVTRPPRTILDAGANIGLAAIFFANRFPNAKIVSLEPEESNLELLRRNTAPYRNVVVVRGALWHQNEQINLVDPESGSAGFMTEARNGGHSDLGRVVHEVRGMTIDAIMKEHGLEDIDILKMDIEGAEREVFRDPSSWLGKVGTLIVELHERKKPGCNASFYAGARGFDHEWLQGENVYMTKNSGCLAGPAGHRGNNQGH